MSETPVYGWVDVSRDDSYSPFSIIDDEDLVKMLREAQDISESSSVRMTPSPVASRPFDDITDLSEVYINNIKDEEYGAIEEYIWSSRPDIHPPKQWNLRKCSSNSSIHQALSNIKMDTKESDEEENYFTLIITNLISLIVGTGIGVFLYKRNSIKHLMS